VTNPEPVIRNIVAFAGLEWDAAASLGAADGTFQAANGRSAADQHQIRSIAGVIREWLQPLIASLGGLPWIDGDIVK